MIVTDDQPYRIPGSLPPAPPAYIPVEPDPREVAMLEAIIPEPLEE
jgi:hypothetical protein